MTAPLPPPDIIDANYGNLYTERKVIFTVREALERAKRKCLVENDFPRNTIRTNTAHDCAKIIDAMIEEYK